jgi:hypothetical protein
MLQMSGCRGASIGFRPMPDIYTKPFTLYSVDYTISEKLH